jgi:hypothetical protein
MGGLYDASPSLTGGGTLYSSAGDAGAQEGSFAGLLRMKLTLAAQWSDSGHEG